jgi:hypothetical protein
VIYFNQLEGIRDKPKEAFEIVMEDTPPEYVAA